VHGTFIDWEDVHSSASLSLVKAVNDDNHNDNDYDNDNDDDYDDYDLTRSFFFFLWTSSQSILAKFLNDTIPIFCQKANYAYRITILTAIKADYFFVIAKVENTWIIFRPVELS